MADNYIVQHAIEEGLKAAGRDVLADGPVTVELHLTPGQGAMVADLAAIMGLTRDGVKNAALAYALATAQERHGHFTAVVRLPQYPKRLRNSLVQDDYDLTVEKVAALVSYCRGDRPLDLGRATVAGIRLLYDALRIRKPVGRPRKEVAR